MRIHPRLLILAALPACGGAATGSQAPGDDPGDPYVPPFAECSGAGATDDDPPPNADCFAPASDPDAPPLLVIEHEFETYEGVDAVHIILTFNPTFVDNTYGVNAIGWDRDHKFRDLVGSDHAELTMSDGDGNVAFDLNLDYISEDSEAPCGYSSLGPFGGDGKVNAGDPAAILGWSTSLDRNFNERGYCEFVEDSPATDAACTPNAQAPDWDFRVVYELWVAVSAFDPAGFGEAQMTSVHASPAKGGENTITVTPGECPCVEIDPGDCTDSTPPDGAACTQDDDCPSGEFCDGGHCAIIVG